MAKYGSNQTFCIRVTAQPIPNGDPLQSGAATAYQSLTPFPGISNSNDCLLFSQNLTE